MPTKRLPMRKIREAIRLRHAGLSHRQIGRSLGQARSTIGDYLQRAEGAGLHSRKLRAFDEPPFR